MGWLPVLLLVAGVLAMLIGYGLIRGVKHRDYLAWRQGREPFDMPENFASENRLQSEDGSATWRPWIIGSAGEPQSVTLHAISLAAHRHVSRVS